MSIRQISNGNAIGIVSCAWKPTNACIPSMKYRIKKNILSISVIMEDDKKAVPTPTTDQLKNCLQQQLDEYEMLSSIFCNTGELKIDDHSVLADIDQFINGHIEQLHRKLDYVITLSILANHKLSIHFELPHSYPQFEWANVILVRCSAPTVAKAQTDNFIQQKIRECIVDADKSEVYVYQVIVWIQENIEQLLANHIKSLQLVDAETAVVGGNEEMERLWIYSHHIKSKTKRQDIIKLAKDWNLSGFCRPGKPGIICVEGRQMDTTEFWKVCRQWSWHRISIRTTEIKTKSVDKMDTFRRFTGFQELIFAEVGDDVLPMEWNGFMKFLDEHNSKYVSKDLFGFE